MGISMRSEVTPLERYSAIVGMIVTVGVLLQQIIMHGQSLFTYFFPMIINGKYMSFLFSNNPQYSLLYKFINIIEFINTLFFLTYSLIIFIKLILRKRVVPRLLFIFSSIAAIYNIIHTVLQNLLSTELKHLIDLNNEGNILFITIDLILIVYYLKSYSFKRMFNK